MGVDLPFPSPLQGEGECASAHRGEGERRNAAHVCVRHPLPACTVVRVALSLEGRGT